MFRRMLMLFALAVVALSAQPQAQAPVPDGTQKQVKTYTLPPEKLAQAVEYARIRHWLHFASFAYGLAVLAALLIWKVAPRFRSWAEAASRRRIVQAYIFVPLLLLAMDLADLPLSVFSQHLALKYHQSVQGWGSWLWDWAKNELLGYALIGLLAWILFGLIRRSARRWWFYFWLVSIPIILLMMFITPVLIEPMFYKFEPLAAKQPALVERIEQVVARGGLVIPRERMFEMEASEKFESLNAYVTGIGASKRVVVWDTTIRKMTPDEILFVFGHEMGHYVLNHIWLGIGVACGALLIGLWAGYQLMRRMIARWGARWDIRGMDDWAALPLLILAFSVLNFVSEPLSNGWSRIMEHDADVYGLEVIHGVVPDAPQAAAQAFQILGEVGLADPNPGPFVEFWLYDHPSVADRVRFSAGYDPWSKGGTPRYVR
jgi:STE24 endopeptidase